MSHALIKRAFEAALESYASGRGLSVAYPGTNFDAPSSMYLACHALPALTDSLALGGDHRLYSGIFQINIVFPAGDGTGDGDEVAQELADHFPLNATFGDVGVQVMTPVSVVAPIISGGLISIPASFSYRLDTN